MKVRELALPESKISNKFIIFNRVCYLFVSTNRLMEYNREPPNRMFHMQTLDL